MSRVAVHHRRLTVIGCAALTASLAMAVGRDLATPSAAGAQTNAFRR